MEHKNIDFNDLENVLSSERLEKYLKYSLGDRTRAIDYYAENIRISASFQLPLHILEVVLRNVVSNALSNSYGKDWIMHCNMFDGTYHKEEVEKKIKKIKEKKKCNITDITYGQIIAAQEFAFWTSMFGRKNDVIWQQCLHNIVIKEKKSNTSRKSFSEPLSEIRDLRNRVAHYEPIIGGNYKYCYVNILNLLSLMSETAVLFCKKYKMLCAEEWPENFSDNLS